jgi:hypothetical protein
MQWTNSRIFFQLQFIIFLVTYFFPIIYFITSNVHTNGSKTMSMYIWLVIASFGKLLLFCIELFQIRIEGWNYLSSNWNKFDQLDFWCFWIFVYDQVHIIYASSGFNGESEDSICFALRQVVLLCAFIKMLYFIRMFQNLGMLVRMIWSCILELRPFLIFFFLFMAMVTISNIALNG